MTGFWSDFDALATLAQVVLIDVTLAADNAIVVSLAVAGLTGGRRRRAMLGGILAATVLRVGFALVAVEALSIIGLTLAGGVLLLWVAWKLFRETAQAQGWTRSAGTVKAPVRGLRRAMVQIALADVSMSLDNVLAVAGTARDHPMVMVAGLVLSVALMGLASTLISRVLDRVPWLAWIGLAIIVGSAVSMIHAGLVEVGPHLMGAFG